jgi:Domain of unknown function (DUF1839)
MMTQILPLDPAQYERHQIHGDKRTWVETNCYVDVWIELLHGMDLEPIAALPFTLAIDFEGDQWTFFKFPLADIYDLYGLDVQELAIWRPLTTHIEEQTALGRHVLVELDSYYLPDTAGTAYRQAHVKSTIAVNAIDHEARYLGYFHNQGYHELTGEDFSNIFRVGEPMDSPVLPPYVEFVKERRAALTGREMIDASLRLLRRQFERLPMRNPFDKFKTRLQADLQWLAGEGLAMFHQYSFATLRQFGACYELAATYLTWLQEQTGTALTLPIEGFANLSTGAKTLQFHLARAIAKKKPLDLSSLDAMASTWQTSLEKLKVIYL